MTQTLGPGNGTDFGPDSHTQTVRIQSFVGIPVWQILHMCVSVCICMRARARLRAGVRANASTLARRRARLRTQLGMHPSNANVGLEQKYVLRNQICIVDYQ